MEPKLEATVKSEYLNELWKLPEVVNPVLKTEGSVDLVGTTGGCSDDSLSPPEISYDKTIKEEQLDKDVTYTILDANLVKTLTKPKRVVKKRTVKQPVAKKHTHKKFKRGTKCTPVDRNINATQKPLFEQLRQIKLEVKLETLLEGVLDTLKAHKTIHVTNKSGNCTVSHDQLEHIDEQPTVSKIKGSTQI